MQISIIRITIIFFAAIFLADAQEHGRIRSRVRRGLQEDLTTQTSTTNDIDDHSPLGYYPVHIVNSSGFEATDVNVNFPACHDYENIDIKDQHDWEQPNGRGGCLVTHISAKVIVDNSLVVVKPYVSSGTSYSQFAIIRDSPAPDKSFVVTRITGSKEGGYE